MADGPPSQLRDIAHWAAQQYALEREHGQGPDPSPAQARAVLELHRAIQPPGPTVGSENWIGLLNSEYLHDKSGHKALHVSHETTTSINAVLITTAGNLRILTIAQTISKRTRSSQ